MTNEMLHDDEGEIRIMGSQAFIGSAIERIRAAMDVSYDGNLRANRYGDGYRAHAHVRLTQPPAPADDDLSPRAAAEQAKRHRDLVSEIGILTSADHELRAQPWFPIQPGDVVCWSIDLHDGGRHGETLVAIDDPDSSTEAGAPLRKVSQTPHGAARADRELEYEDFYDVWFEAGPTKVAVIRHGQLVHGSLVQ